MPFKRVTFTCLLLYLATQIDFSTAYNCSSSDLQIPVFDSWKVIFIFNCYPVTASNPLFPTSYSQQATKYNEIDLSPNVYTVIPTTQLCSFRNLITLDLSFNLLQSASFAFKELTCLTALKIINLSNNRIITPILATDFDDIFSFQLESLNFTNNLIPYVQTRAFLKADGSSRFPNLNYLGLAMNKLKDLDLLWPLTLPHPKLLIDIKLNNISFFTNELNLTFNNVWFKYPMVNDRYLDATTNSLQGFDDFNLLQYGLHNEQHLREFLFKISNYDFRQSNLVPTFICFCPSYGQLTLFWFKSISQSVDRTRPIYQIYCSNSVGNVYVLDFPCGPTTKYNGPTTTTYSTLFPFQYQAFTQAPTTSKPSTTIGQIITGNIANQFAETTTKASNSSLPVDSNQNNNNNYFFLFFLFIPFFVIICLIFICCIGRCCQKRTNAMCNLVFCPCFRPYDESRFNTKTIDATICCNKSNEDWLKQEFIPMLNDSKYNYKINKLNIQSRTSDKTNQENENILRTSKRIILIFTQEFVEEEFRNKFFTNILRDIKDDPNCVIIAVNKELESRMFKNYVKYLNSPYDPVNPRYRSRRSIFMILKSRIKYNCGLREVEKLDFNKRNFWRDLFYIMPFLTYSTKIINEYDNLPKKKGRKFEVKPDLSYASDIKNSKEFRHVIIPIPDFMRTTLGLKKNKETERESRYNLQQQDSQTNAFSSMSFTSAPSSTRIEEKRSRSNSRVRDRSPFNNQVSTIQDQLSVKSSLPHNNQIAVINKRERSESADILAMFAPAPNTVYPIKKKSRKLSRNRKSSRSSEQNHDLNSS